MKENSMFGKSTWESLDTVLGMQMAPDFYASHGIDVVRSLVANLSDDEWRTVETYQRLRGDEWRVRLLQALPEPSRPQQSLILLIEMLTRGGDRVAVAAFESLECFAPAIEKRELGMHLPEHILTRLEALTRGMGSGSHAPALRCFVELLSLAYGAGEKARKGVLGWLHKKSLPKPGLEVTSQQNRDGTFELRWTINREDASLSFLASLSGGHSPDLLNDASCEILVTTPNEDGTVAIRWRRRGTKVKFRSRICGTTLAPINWTREDILQAVMAAAGASPAAAFPWAPPWLVHRTDYKDVSWEAVVHDGKIQDAYPTGGTSTTFAPMH